MSPSRQAKDASGTLAKTVVEMRHATAKSGHTLYSLQELPSRIDMERQSIRGWRRIMTAMQQEWSGVSQPY